MLLELYHSISTQSEVKLISSSQQVEQMGSIHLITVHFLHLLSMLR